jgi:hypothetical protein
MDVKISVSRFLDIQLSNSTGRRTPTRVADGHADSHDEYCMVRCKSIRNSLRRQGEIVVTDKVASAGGAQMRGNGVVFRPAAPMQPPGERNRFAPAIKPARRRLWVLLFFGLAERLLYGVLIANGRKCFIARNPLQY